MHSASQALPRQTLTTTTTIPQPSPTHQHHQHRGSHFHSHSATQLWQPQPVTTPYYSVHPSLCRSRTGQDTSSRDTTHPAHTSLRSIRTPKHTAGHSLGSPTYCAHLPNRLDAYRIRLSPPRLSLPRISQAPHHSPHRTAPHARNGWDS
ncbi:hypothetical protein CGCSCA5_v003324 [Colletotrichum siamense]|nr:hypothetical protein CGCSCA5_v003324 [Colletotrichum siamense]